MLNRYELSVRQEGTSAASDEVSYGNGDLAALRMVILIHGSANPRNFASANYQDFRTALRSALWLDHDLKPLGTIWDFHWPSDHPGTFDPWRLRSRVRYEYNVHIALSAGRSLADFIAQMDPRQQVALVAHSLGCRVVLECLKRLRSAHPDRGATVTKVCLMAAAVPTPLCEPDKLYGETLPHCREAVLHSTRDKVLRWAFPAGQRQFEPGRAVGSTGRPDHRWQHYPDTRLGHGGYWRDFHVAEIVGQMLGVVHTRTIPEQTIEEVDGFG